MKRVSLVAGAALTLFSVASARADSYRFTFTSAVYDISNGLFTTSSIENADGTYDIISASGDLTSTDSLLPQGAFTLYPGNATSPGYLIAPGSSTYNNTYTPGTDFFAFDGAEFEGATFDLNMFNGPVGGDPECPGNCLAVPGTATYNPGELGTQTITLVPEPSTWALVVAGLGGLGLMLRRSRKITALEDRNVSAA